MTIDPKIIRGAFIGKLLKEIIEKKGVTITEISERIKTAQPAISNALNAKKSVSDDFFKRIASGIPITEKELKKIFFEAEKEKIKYEFGEELLSSKEFSFDELLEMVKEKKNLTDEEIQSVRKFIEFQENQKK